MNEWMKERKIIWVTKNLHSALTIYSSELLLRTGKKHNFSQTIEYALRRAVTLDRFIACVSRDVTQIYDCYENIIGDLRPVTDEDSMRNIERRLAPRQVSRR